MGGFPTGLDPAAGRLELSALAHLAKLFQMGIELDSTVFVRIQANRSTVAKRLFPTPRKEPRKNLNARIGSFAHLRLVSWGDIINRAAKIRTPCGRKLFNNEKNVSLRPPPPPPPPPAPSLLRGEPSSLANLDLDIASRFGVEQIDKLRACDGTRHARTNLACAVATPYQAI